MKKRVLTCLLACVTAFSFVGTSCDMPLLSKEEEKQIVWDNYEERTESYVSDLYYYKIPEVRDNKGNEYEVFVEVTDSNGEKVDSFGGFFQIEKAEEYKVTYTIDDGEKIYTKTTIVAGIEKAKYELTDSELVFGLNETVNLEGKVVATTDGEMTYSVKKDGEKVALTDNTFVTAEEGIYAVEVSIPKQPSYSFNIFAVDEKEIPYAKGLILDGTDKQDFVVGETFEDFTTEVTFDESVKYDSQSNGSYKIVAKTPKMMEVPITDKEGNVTGMENKRAVAEHRTVTFSIKPPYDSNYYKTLEKYGYEYVAIRYRLDELNYDGTARFNYISGAGANEMLIYYDGEEVVRKSETHPDPDKKPNPSYTFWQSELDRTPRGGWAEMLLDIKKFTSYYEGGETPIFQFLVNKYSSLDITMYIDNIYAVKGEAISSSDMKIVEKGAEVDLSELSADTGLAEPISTITFDNEFLTVTDGKLKVENYGLYSIAITDRQMYGSVKQDIIANGSIVSYSPTNFSVKHGNANSSVSNFKAMKGDSANEMVISSDGVGKVNKAWQRTTYTVKTLGDKAYYEQLKADGYRYITYEYTLDYGDYAMIANTSVYRAALTKNKIPHYNSGGLNADTAATHQWLCVNDNTSGDTATKTSNKYFQSTSYPNELWNKKTFIISVSIDDFIKFYNADGMNILTLYFSAAQPEMDYSVTFGRIFPTKEACKFENS